MREYHKIETVYERDMDGSKKLIEGRFRCPEVEYLKDLQWVFTEKIDGTNIRVHWDGHDVEVAGRTDRASLPAELATYLSKQFLTPESEQMFEQMFGEKEVYLFGEGYGRRIQGSGGSYIPDGVSFILFDVMVGDNYLPREAVEKIGEAFGVGVVPVLLVGTLEEAIAFVKSHPMSEVAEQPLFAEGVVGHPVSDLRKRDGGRIIVKIKFKDFSTEAG